MYDSMVFGISFLFHLLKENHPGRSTRSFLFTGVCAHVREEGSIYMWGFLPLLCLVQAFRFFVAWVMHLSSVIIVITMVLTAL